MAPVTVVTAVYVADTSRYVKAVDQATASTRQFAGALPAAEQASGRLNASTVALGAAVGTLGAMAFAKAAAAIKQYAMQGIQAAAQYEQTVISIEGIFQGSGMSMQAAASKTKSYLADLRDFAARTPFELPQTLDAVKRLLSIGYTADKVKNDMLPTIGDIVAALGQPAAAISGVVYAFGQMKSAGRVLSQDLMQIGNALPGFNAKMAIANEMFGGNLQEMQAAMEKGTVSSEQAIEALLKAMQKFPGAAGAMARQSKTLNGVISTFKDTVNNALIDGLMPAMPALSGALERLVGPVSSVATAFAQNLGPAVIAGVQAVEALAPAMTEIIPPLLQLISASSSFSEVIVALAPVISVVATALGAMAQVVGAIPAPILVAIGTVLLFQRAMTMLGLKGKQETATTASAFSRFAMAVKIHMRASSIATLAAAEEMSAGMRSVTASALTMNAAVARANSPFAMLRSAVLVTATGVKGAFVSMATAARGFMSALGPVGLAIAAAGAAMEVFAGQSAATKAAVEQLRDQVDLTTNSLNKMGLAWVASQLRENISQEDIDNLRGYGIAWDDVLSAISNGGPQWDALKAKMDAVNDSTIGPSNMSFDTIQRTIEGMAAWVAASKGAAADVAKANEEAARLSGEAAMRERDQMIGAITSAAAERKAAYDAMSVVQQQASARHASEVASYESEEQRRASAARDAANAVVEAGRSIIAMFDRLHGITSRRSAKSSWAKSLKGIGEALNEAAAQGEKGTMKAGGRGYDALTAAMDASLSLAALMPVKKRAAFLAKAAKEIEDQFAKSGTYKVPAKGKIKEHLLSRAGFDVGSQMKGWNDVVGDTVKDVNAAVKQEKALREQGLSSGVKWTDGLLEAIRNGEDPLVAAAAALGDKMRAAFTEHGYISLGGDFPTKPTPMSKDSLNTQGMTVYNYTFGDLKVASPQDAARQATNATKLNRLSRGRSTDPGTGGAYTRW